MNKHNIRLSGLDTLSAFNLKKYNELFEPHGDVCGRYYCYQNILYSYTVNRYSIECGADIEGFPKKCKNFFHLEPAIVERNSITYYININNMICIEIMYVKKTDFTHGTISLFHYGIKYYNIGDYYHLISQITSGCIYGYIKQFKCKITLENFDIKIEHRTLEELLDVKYANNNLIEEQGSYL